MIAYLQCLTFVCLAVALLGNAQVHGESLTEYIIWPRANITDKDVTSVERLLRSLTLDPTRLYTSKNPSGPVPSFWLAILDHDSYQRVSRHPNVRVMADLANGLDPTVIDIARYSRSVLMKTLSCLRM